MSMALKHIIMVLEKLKNRTCVLQTFITASVLLSCAHISGVFPIVGNIYYWDAGTPFERMIVYNDSKTPWNMVSGIPVFPSDSCYQCNATLGITEYVEEFSHNTEWILARTVFLMDSVTFERYWVLHIPNNTKMNMNLIKESTYGPFDCFELDSVVTLKGIPDSLYITVVAKK